MRLKEAGTVIYFGIFASFFGGWVPVRAKNFKLTLFHLYLFLSMLILPLLIYLVDGTRIAGWIVYCIWTFAVFAFLKIINYRLHSVLGTDPVSEPESEANEHSEHENDEPLEKEKLDERGLEENLRSTSEEVVLDDKETLPQEDIEYSRHRSSASTLNDASSVPNTGTPDIELSQLSQPIPTVDNEEEVTGSVDNEIAKIQEGDVHNIPNKESSSPVEDVPLQLDNNETMSSSPESDGERHMNGSRQRVCQRYPRHDSRNSRRGLDQGELLSPPPVEDVRQYLNNHSLTELADVVNKMPTRLHEAILNDDVTPENYQLLNDRINQLRNGHLAAGDYDDTTGAIHWFEESGMWDFYSFDPPEEMDPVFMALQQLQASFHESLRPPSPPPRRHINESPGPYEGHTPHPHPDAVIPSIMIIPRIHKTKVNLTFTRRQLEEYMDRNVSLLETVVTIILSVLVCLIGALLLTVTDFYRDFWVFVLCFVIATTHFSLIKSVQSDPASPGPGQNRINAMSRAVYFIAVGSLGLLLDGILRHNDNFSPFCVYGFNLNSQPVLFFVRDGLFIFLLFLPILFTLGWMPQFDTFFITVLEHIDVHIFGGTASTGFVCSVYSIARNILVVLLLWPLGYAAFVSLEMDPPFIGNDCTQTFAGYHDDPLLSPQCSNVGRIALSFFLGGVVSMSYVLSRATNNYQYILDLIICGFKYCWHKIRSTSTAVSLVSEDPLEEIYRNVMRKRLLADVLVAVFLMIVVTLLNITSLFCQNEIVAYVTYGITAILGILNHYFLPHLRKENPYLCFSEPCIKSNEYDQFEVTDDPKVSIIERILQVTTFLEKNIFYPLTFLFALNLTAIYYRAKFGEYAAPFVVAIVGMKLFRSSYSELPRQHVILILSLLFFNVDYAHLNEGLPLNYFITAILFNKFYDLYLKIYFIFIYIMPGSWSSPFHIVIQPLLIPHCPLIFFETLIGAIVGAPINPIIASSMFFLSYARPIKFWEKDYNTKRRDTSNTRLEQQLDSSMRNPNPDHLDSLFYEQLTWSLQRDLCGDILLGRWGRVVSGDFFIMSNDQLNALVHIIEVGNGFVTFQLRGLEFRGTYCHQREREAITEPLADEDSCLCRLPFTLPCNKALCARWMAWEVISSSYTLHGYSISENQAHLVFNAFDYKKAFITYYVKCIIYYLIKLPRIRSLLTSLELQQSLVFLSDRDAIDVDPLFDQARNIDCGSRGITRSAFVTSHYDFIQFCANKQFSSDEIDTSEESFLVTLCFAFSLLGRRLFFAHATSGSNRRNDNFMHGLYRMFLGDARPNSDKDDWIFLEVDCIQQIIIPAARIALKVHQDNFTLSDQYESSDGIYDAIQDAEENHVVTHENDKAWRDGVVLNRPSLLALRYQRTEDTYIHPYKIIRLTSKFIKFRIVKLNRECVRGLWSSQQHELIFLRNSDSERGSIQNHKATLRNMINSSMDLPIGYPIYVSPLQTSFLDRHASFNQSQIGHFSNPLDYIRFIEVFKDWCQTCAERYQGSRNQPRPKTSSAASSQPISRVGARLTGSSDSLTGYQPENVDPFANDSDSDDDFWKPIWIGKQVVISDEEAIFFSFNENWLQWPDKTWPHKAVQSHWKGWRPAKGITGEVIHEWRPFHMSSTSRSHIDKVIVLIKATSTNNLVLIKEQGVQEV